MCVPTGELVRTFGGYGAGPGLFNGPARICTTPADTLLVADRNNHRVQEVTFTGEHCRFIGSEFLLDPVFGVATIDDLVAVGKVDGTTDHRVMMFSLSGGSFIRQFAGNGDGESPVLYVQLALDGVSFCMKALGTRPLGHEKRRS